MQVLGLVSLFKMHIRSYRRTLTVAHQYCACGRPTLCFGAAMLRHEQTADFASNYTPPLDAADVLVTITPPLSTQA